MKVIKKKWFLFYGKVLSAAIALLGLVSSCSLSRKTVHPVMYGIPDSNFIPVDTVKPNPNNPREFRAMYGVAPVRYEQIEKDGVKIKIKQ